MVALFTRAWIEIFPFTLSNLLSLVALFTRAWIEILEKATDLTVTGGRPLYEGVD